MLRHCVGRTTPLTLLEMAGISLAGTQVVVEVSSLSNPFAAKGAVEAVDFQPPQSRLYGGMIIEGAGI